MHGGLALWQEEKKEFYKLRLVLLSKNYLMECGTQKKELPYGDETYKVGEKIVV